MTFRILFLIFILCVKGLSAHAQKKDSLVIDSISTVVPISLTNIDTLINNAKSLYGVKYKWGGVSLKGFDCSGFTQYVFGLTGIPFPRSTQDQYCLGDEVDSLNHAMPGDLIFFKPRNRENRIGHVGIISRIEEGKIYMIHASSSQGIIETNYSQSSYWKTRFYAIKRWKFP